MQRERNHTSQAAYRSLRAALLRWYDSNARSLPWRRVRNPYRIWVAEVMLQQTRVEVVLPAYRRFVRALPTLARLAEAEEDEVLSLWSGLGYYFRARSLHRAARELRRAGERTFPHSMEAARSLPGVGPYTAAAVLSIAYGDLHAAVDGNVVRVLSRLARLARPNAAGEPHLSLAGRLLDRRRPGDWNQALMELGQTVCLPRAPRCGACPLKRRCQAHTQGVSECYPPPHARSTPQRVRLEITVTRDRGGRLLLERGAFPYLDHLWLPPLRILEDNGRPLGSPRQTPARAVFRHAILHRQFEVRVAERIVGHRDLRRMTRRRIDGRIERRLFEPADLYRVGRSSLLTKALRAVHFDLHSQLAAAQPRDITSSRA